MNIFTRETLRRAGRSRVRTARDLAEVLAGMPASEVSLAKRLLGAATIAGGSVQTIIETTAPAALSAAAATFIGPIVGIPQAPLVLAFLHVPTITGATAATVLTFTIRRTDTPAIISQQLFTTATGDTNPRGPVMLGVVPFGIPASSGVDAQGTAAAGAGTLTASATAPLILAVVGLS